MDLSRGRQTVLTLPFLASVCLALSALGAPAEGSYGVSWGGRGPLLVTLDPEGNRNSIQTPKGPTTSFEYDELGKLLRVLQPPPDPSLDPTPLKTEYVYDENRNRILQIDANLHSVKMEYDELNRLKKTTQDPGGLELISETVRFDENSNPEVVKDPKGQTITSTFDELNRLDTKSFAFAEGDDTRPWRYTAWLEYGYDENGNLLTTDEHVVSRTGQADTTLTTSHTYDGLDRLTSESQPLPDGTSALVKYSYFKNGLRKTVTDPALSVTQYTYDGQNRLETAVTGFGTADAQTTRYTYWPDDLLHTVSYPNGVVATHDYDKADRLVTLTNAKGATPVSSYTYTYDDNGNRLTQLEANGGLTETTGYTYDDLDRLTSVTYPVDAAYPAGRVVSYGYDAVGNRRRETEKDSADTLLADKQGVFDNANRLTDLQDLVTPPNSTSFTWDDNGNQLSKTTAGVTTEYRYDLRDKLVEVVQGPSTLGRFQYDAQGRRNLKIGEEGLRQYVYDQTSLFAEYDAADSQKAKYDYGSDRLISLTRTDEGRRYFSLDGLRSVVNLTDDQGNEVASYHLDAWGNFRFPEELTQSANRFAFTGHIWDQETGLYNAKARYFDPELGRFLTQDSFPGQIDEPPSLHRYVYGWNRPTFFVDSSGYAATRAEIAAKADEIERTQGRQAAFLFYMRAMARPMADASNQVAAPINQRLEGLAGLAVPGGVAYVTGKQDDASWTRVQQRKLLDVAGDPSRGGFVRAAAGAAGVVAQPFAVVNDIVQGLAAVPGQLGDAAGEVREAFQVESPTGAALELTEAVEKTASAAETTLAALLLARGGAKVVQEARSASRTKVVPVEDAPKPTADYGADAAWRAYYDAHPEFTRSVGAAGARRGAPGEAPGLSRPKPRRGDYLGRTPGKSSRTGREVAGRMTAEGKLRQAADGTLEVKAGSGEWVPISQTDMGHLTDAVTWWNEEGRFHGKRTPPVREFMLESQNYEFQESSENRSRGAKLKQTYLPPIDEEK